MKICSKCKGEKNLNSFSKNSSQPDGYQRYCKLCKKEYDNEKREEYKSVWRESNKQRNNKQKRLIEEFILDLGGECIKCKENRKHVLDFHHKNPKNKIDIISNILNFYGPNKKGILKAKKEVEKCILLCSNCHRDFHFLEKIKNINLKEYLNG